MGIVGVLLSGGCGASPLDSDYDAFRRRAAGATVTVGSSFNANKVAVPPRKKMKGGTVSTPSENRHIRILIVAPSNAAVDELVLRLCEVGVPGADGRALFPKVVRIGVIGRDEDEEGIGEGTNVRSSCSSSVQVSGAPGIREHLVL